MFGTDFLVARTGVPQLTLFRQLELPAGSASQSLSRQCPQVVELDLKSARHSDRTCRWQCSADDLLPVDGRRIALGGFAGTMPADSWKAGAAQHKITPEQPMWMAGYGIAQSPGHRAC